jgi:hypothetical protein
MHGALPGSFLSRCDKGTPAHRLASWRYLKTFSPDALLEALGLFFLSFPSRVLGSVVFPTQVNLFLQQLDSTGQLMGNHAHASQTFVF